MDMFQRNQDIDVAEDDEIIEKPEESTSENANAIWYKKARDESYQTKIVCTHFHP